MKSIILDERDILEYIRDIIYDVRKCGMDSVNAKYHHNTAYEDAASICKYGILTLVDLNKYGLRNDTEEFLKIMGDNTSHVNGNDRISLAVVGLTDIYPNEDIYNPFSPYLVDFLVNNCIETSRSSIHYGNEFLSYNSITKEQLESVDVRLLKLLNSESNLKNLSVISVLNKYNSLINVAEELQKQKLDIPLREMSDSSIFELDIERLASQPKILLKNK